MTLKGQGMLSPLANMQEFLSCTRYCDVEAPAIHRTLATMRNGEDDDIVVAVRIFRFVRDVIRYTFRPWGLTASNTLRHVAPPAVACSISERMRRSSPVAVAGAGLIPRKSG